MAITLGVFEQSPDRGRGLARDMPVRWALEEVGVPYTVRPLSFSALKEADHRQRHPFGQIPTFEDGELVLFESGAIVLHVAERHPGLLPLGGTARAHAIMWMFSALSTLEPPILDREFALREEREKAWREERAPILEHRVRARLEALSFRLGQADWLDDAFSAGDLMVATVLRRLKISELLNDYPNLAAYVARAEGRPAFQRAFDAQFALFLKSGQAAP